MEMGMNQGLKDPVVSHQTGIPGKHAGILKTTSGTAKREYWPDFAGVTP
jgi:hypothetical protein